MDNVRTERGSGSTAPGVVCPSWCTQEHLGGAGAPFGHYHDGESTLIPLENVVGPARGAALCVNVSQYAEAGSAAEPPLVEVQDESRTLFLLTPHECLQLARALLENAGVVAAADPGDREGLDRLRCLAAEVRERSGRLALAAGAAQDGVLDRYRNSRVLYRYRRNPDRPRSTP